MALSGAQLKTFREALMAAFPDETDLKMMVLDELEERLNAIAEGKNYKTTVLEFVEWAEANGKLREVVIGASRANPGNPQLKKFVNQAFETLLDPPELLSPDLTNTLLPRLRNLLNLQIVSQCCCQLVPSDLIQIYYPKTIETLENDQLSSDVRWLAALELVFHAYPKQTDNIPTILEFVDRLRKHPDLSPQSQKALTEWLTPVTPQYDYPIANQPAEDESPAQTGANLKGYLLITIKRKITGAGGFLVHGFLMVKMAGQNLNQSQLIPIETLSGSQTQPTQQLDSTSQKGASCTLEEIKQQVPLWVRQAKAYLIRQGAFDLTVEFFLPYEDLATEVDLWKIPDVIARRKKDVALGQKHRVVVRSTDRLEDPDLLSYLLQAWDKIEPLLDAKTPKNKIQNRCEVFPQPDGCRLQKLAPRLRQCIALRRVDAMPNRKTDREEFFVELLKAGVPIALWSRKTLTSISLDKELNQFLVPEYLCDLDHLLEQIRQTRENAHNEKNSRQHLGYHLGILCDEPERLNQLNQFIRESGLWLEESA